MGKSHEKTNIQLLLHVETPPLTNSLQNVAIRDTCMIVETHLPKLCMLHLPLIHVHCGDIVVHKLKMLLFIVLHK